MGTRSGAICNQCETRFTINDGGGFFSHLLHCDACGAERSIGFDEIDERHLRHLRGLRVPHCMASEEHDCKVQETYQGEPMTQDEYHEAVEKICGTCECGGQFRFEAPARCPKCRCTDHREDPARDTIRYD